MTISLQYLDDLSRVRITLSDLPDGTVRVERSVNEDVWETVRGGSELTVSGGEAELDDYEFAADRENFYRVRQRRWDDKVEIFESDGTWDKPAGLVAAKVTVVGGGGAGGGADSTGADEASGGTGGGGGVTAISWIDADDLGSSETVTVGSGGSGVAGGDGGDGGTSTFTRTTGDDVSADGGEGGQIQGPTSPPGTQRPSSAEDGGTGDVVLGGQAGHPPVLAGTGGGANVGGTGGSSAFGGGGRGDVNSDGQTGRAYGGGGGGASNAESQGSDRAGGDGADGVVIVEHFFDEV